jgi:hypothetical protein
VKLRALVKAKLGVRLEMEVMLRAGRKRLLIVTLRRAA